MKPIPFFVAALWLGFVGEVSAEDRLHFDAAPGMGMNAVINEGRGDRYGAGLTVATALVYEVSGSVAWELSSILNLARVSGDYLLWDTLFFVGGRFRIGPFFSVAGGDPSFRVFGGWGPAVAVFDAPRSGVARYHLSGPGAGFGIRQTFRTEAGTPYFWEWSVSYHRFRKYAAVRSAGELPETLGEGAVFENSRSLGTQFTVGFRIF